jgi:hypothetical protein
MTITTTTTIIICLLGCGVLGGSLIMARNQVAGTDFLAFYAGGRLAATGHLYDPQAIWKIQTEAIGKYGPSLLFIRLPCFALFLWPLARLPYAIAQLIWLAIQMAGVAAAICSWPGSRKLAMIVICWSLPVIMCFADGTDTPLVLLWLVLWRRLEVKNRHVWAGLALALCIAKFHLFLILPLLLFRHRRWLVIKGLVIGASALLGLSFLSAGWRWPVGYLHVLTASRINPGRAVMPNIHGLVPPELETPMVILVVMLSCAAIFKLDYSDALIVTFFGSFLCSYHAYVMDGVVLLPAILLAIEKYYSRWPAYIAGLFATPIPWVAVLLRGL